MPPIVPRRILLLKPCCIGDVVLTTPLLAALRRAYPDAHITWGIGTHSAPVIENHPLLDAILPTGPAANPAKSRRELWQLSRQIRAGRFDMAVVPVRSPLVGLAVQLAGVRVRAGLNSAGRGLLFYNKRAKVDPQEVRHESEIYLDLARALGLDVTGCWANVHVSDEQIAALPVPNPAREGLIVVHVGGGVNPGMTMVEKRPPIPLLAEVVARTAEVSGGHIAVLGGPGDEERAAAFQQILPSPLRERTLSLVAALDFSQLAVLGAIAALVIGPDTGVMHLLSAAGAPTVMIFGPSDPGRYAPFVPPGQAVAPWRPLELPSGGVASGPPPDWSWESHGVSADEVWAAARTLLK